MNNQGVGVGWLAHGVSVFLFVGACDATDGDIILLHFGGLPVRIKQWKDQRGGCVLHLLILNTIKHTHKKAWRNLMARWCSSMTALTNPDRFSRYIPSFETKRKGEANENQIQHFFKKTNKTQTRKSSGEWKHNRLDISGMSCKSPHTFLSEFRTQ